MEIDYKKLTGAIALGMITASAVKAGVTATTAAVSLWWTKRQLTKEVEKELEK